MNYKNRKKRILREKSLFVIKRNFDKTNRFKNVDNIYKYIYKYVCKNNIN